MNGDDMLSVPKTFLIRELLAMSLALLILDGRRAIFSENGGWCRSCGTL